MKMYKVIQIDMQFDEMTTAFYTEKALLESFPDVKKAPNFDRPLATYHLNKDDTVGYALYIEKIAITESGD